MSKSLTTIIGAILFSISASFTSYAADASMKDDGVLEGGKKEGYEDIKTTTRTQFEEEDRVSKHMDMDKEKQRLLELSYLNEEESDISTDIFRGQLTIASLFNPQQQQGLFNGFYRLIGLADTDSTAKFTFTGGYFLPNDIGELIFGYRLLSAKIRQNIPTVGEYEEKGLENSAIIKYSKRFDSMLGVINADLFYSNLDTDGDTFILESSEDVVVKTGSGDIDTWYTTLGYSLGGEGWDNPALSGLRLDLGGGYEEVYYREFDVIPETSEKGFVGYVKLAVLTPLGKIAAKYRDGQGANVGSIEWQAGNLRCYWREYEYAESSDTRVAGCGISGDLRDFRDFRNYLRTFFQRPQRLFREGIEGYDDINFVDFADIEGESRFVSKPKTFGVARSEDAGGTGTPAPSPGPDGSPPIILTPEGPTTIPEEPTEPSQPAEGGGSLPPEPSGDFDVIIEDIGEGGGAVIIFEPGE